MKDWKDRAIRALGAVALPLLLSSEIASGAAYEDAKKEG
jgi:hypothetical protein